MCNPVFVGLVACRILGISSGKGNKYSIPPHTASFIKVNQMLELNGLLFIILLTVGRSSSALGTPMIAGLLRPLCTVVRYQRPTFAVMVIDLSEERVGARRVIVLERYMVAHEHANTEGQFLPCAKKRQSMAYLYH